MLSKTLLLLFTVTAGAAQVPVPPQQPPRDPSRPAGQQQAVPIGTALISGIVTMGGSGQPARKVRVNLSGQELRGGRSTTTDDQGRFSFTALPAGRYSLSASRPGFLSTTYGARRPGTQGTPIQLSDGQKFQAQLQLPKGSVLTGMVLDENGEATPGTSVRAMRFMMQGGRRTLQQSGSGSTDDRGVYRIYNLQPADYIVCASPRNTAMGDFERMQVEMRSMRQALQSVNAAQRVPEDQVRQIEERIAQLQASMPQQQDDVPAGYAPVCYPGTIVTSQASPIALGVGEERSGIDFQLQLVPMARIEGTVVNSTGQPLQNIQLTLQDASAIGTSLSNVNSTRADAEGRFRFPAVAPGQYRLTARAQVGAPGRGGRGDTMGFAIQGRGGPPAPQRVEPTIVWASADISVGGQHLSNVMLALQPGLSITGQLAFDGATPPPTDLSRLRVSVMPAEPGPTASGGNGRVDANGRFTIPSVSPGRYRLSASGGQGWYVDSVIVGGQDALDFPFEVKAESLSGVTVTFTDKQTELTGMLVDDKGQPAVDYTLVIFPADQRYWGGSTRRTRTARPGTDGRFTILGLPPGEYKLATVVDLDPGATSDPAYLQSIESATMRITLQPGEKKTQDIRLR